MLTYRVIKRNIRDYYYQSECKNESIYIYVRVINCTLKITLK